MSPEERIGAAVAAYLRGQGFAVYAEVVGPWGKQRPDIVAVGAGGAVHVVECKVCLSWDAIAQARGWRGWSHNQLVATAKAPAGRGYHAARDALHALGVGWLTTDGGVTLLLQGTTDTAPQRAGIMLDALRPEHQASRPGTASGEHYTATQERDARLRAHVAAHPGVELRQACDALGIRLDADGRRALARHVRCALDGVTAQRDGRRLLLWPAERTM